MNTQEWEYFAEVVQTSEAWREKMNVLGKDGWELVSVVANSYKAPIVGNSRVADHYAMFFKRPKP